MANDNFLVLGLCYCWSSFHNRGSYLHRVFSLFFVDCLLLFFLWVVSTRAFICLVLLMDGFLSLIFIYMVFLHVHCNVHYKNITNISTMLINTCFNLLFWIFIILKVFLGVPSMWSYIVKLDEKKSKTFWLGIIMSVKCAAMLCTCKKESDKHDLIVIQCFWLAHHNDWSKWFAITSPPPISCPSFCFMGGVKKRN